MSFVSPIVLKDAAAANQNFIRLASDKTQVSYALQTATLNAPVLLVIGHQMTSSPEGSDRHLVKISRTVIGTDSKARTAVLNCTLSVPRNTISRTDVNNCIAELREFLNSTANVDALLRGEL